MAVKPAAMHAIQANVPWAFDFKKELNLEADLDLTLVNPASLQV